MQKAQRLVAWCAPYAYLAACWCLLLAPQALSPVLPHLRLWGLDQTWTAARVNSTLSLYLPSSPAVAWQLGLWAGQQSASSSPLDAGAMQSTLQQAAALLQLPPDFPFQQYHLQEVGRLLQAKQGQGLTLAALHSAMSLANIVSLVAITGMAVWIGPAMKQLLWPLLKHMARRLRAVYNRVAGVLVAVTKAMLPVYAWIGFYISLLVLKAAPRYGPAAQSWVAVLGYVLAIFSFLYCINFERVQDRWYQGGPHIQVLKLEEELWLCWMLAASMFPSAILLQSQLLGFGAAGAAYLMLIQLADRIGQLREGAQEQAAAYADTRHVDSSLLLLLPYIAAKAGGLPQSWWQPFSFGMSLLGPLCAYIHSWCLGSGQNVLVCVVRRRHVRLTSPQMHVLLLLSGLGVGWLLQLPGLFNMATTMGCLWLYQLVRRLFAWETYRTVMTFLGFLMLMRASVFFSANPEWLASMLAV